MMIRLVAAVAILGLSAGGAVAEDTPDETAAFVALVCTPELLAEKTPMLSKAACDCAIMTFVDRFGVRGARTIVLNELPSDMSRDEAKALVDQATPMIPEVNALCGTTIGQ